MALGDKQGKALTTTVRPSSVDVRAQQMNVFPLDAFEFTNPNKKKATDAPITLSMKEGWELDVGRINFGKFDEDTQEIIRTAFITAEENRLMISNTEGTLQLEADILDIIARELNLTGDTISLTANKLLIYNPSDEDETESLDQVLKIESGNVYFGAYDEVTPENGAGMKWDQNAGEFKIQGSLDVKTPLRSISVGGQGLKALDASSNILHDIPDKASSTDYFYMGHLYLLTTFNQGYLGSLSNTLKTYTALDLGVSNVKGVRIMIQLSTNNQSQFGNYVLFRKYGDSGQWAYRVGASGYEQSSSLYSSGNSIIVDVPVDTLGRFQAWSQNASSGSVYQLGFYV